MRRSRSFSAIILTATAACSLIDLLAIASPSPGEGLPFTRDEAVLRLASDEVTERWEAAYAIGEAGSKAAGQDIAESLHAILAQRSEHEYVRGAAAWALGRIGPVGGDADRNSIRLLIDVLTSAHISVRRNAPLALAALLGENDDHGPSSTPANAEPTPSADDGDDDLRTLAVAGIVPLLDDPDRIVKARAAVALIQLGPTDQLDHARARIAEWIAASDGQVAYAAVAALENLAPLHENLKPPLLAALGHDDEDVRHAAAEAVARYGDSVVPDLADIISTSDRPEEAQRRVAAVAACETIGGVVDDALLAALDDPDARVRRRACFALGRLSSRIDHATNDGVVSNRLLAIVRDDDDRQVRDAAAWALDRCRANDTPPVDAEPR